MFSTELKEPPSPEAAADATINDTVCSTGSLLGQHQETGALVLIPLCCKSWKCPRCAARLSRAWARRVAQALPERFLTITVDPKLHESPFVAYVHLQEAFTQMVKVWRRGKKVDGKVMRTPHVFEYFAMLEIQPGTGYPHLHVLQKGDYIPQAWISKFMINAGIGEVQNIKRVNSGPGAAWYVTKYTAKGTDQVKQLIGHRRLIWMSRHFLVKEEVAAKPSEFIDFEWIRISTAPDVALDFLKSHFDMTVDGSRWPGVLLLIPRGPPEDLFTLAATVDPLLLDKQTFSECPVSLTESD